MKKFANVLLKATTLVLPHRNPKHFRTLKEFKTTQVYTKDTRVLILHEDNFCFSKWLIDNLELRKSNLWAASEKSSSSNELKVKGRRYNVDSIQPEGFVDAAAADDDDNIDKKTTEKQQPSKKKQNKGKKDAGQQPVQQPGQQPGKKKQKKGKKDSGQQPGKKKQKKGKTDAGQQPGQQPGKKKQNKGKKDSGQQPGKKKQKKGKTDAGQQPEQQPGQQPGKQPEESTVKSHVLWNLPLETFTKDERLEKRGCEFDCVIAREVSDPVKVEKTFRAAMEWLPPNGEFHLFARQNGPQKDWVHKALAHEYQMVVDELRFKYGPEHHDYSIWRYFNEAQLVAQETDEDVEK